MSSISGCLLRLPSRGVTIALLAHGLTEVAQPGDGNQTTKGEKKARDEIL